MTDNQRDTTTPPEAEPDLPATVDASPAPAAAPADAGPAAPKVAPTPPPRPAGGGGAGKLALVVALVAAGGAGYSLYQWNLARQQAAGFNAEIEARVKATLAKVEAEAGDRIKALEGKLASSQQAVGALEGKLGTAEQAQGAALKEASDRIEQLSLGQRGLLAEVDAAKTAAARGDVNALALSEVGYLLRVADHKLHLELDQVRALQALQLAETRLNAVNELAFASVSRMLAENIAAVRGVKLPDTAALGRRLIELEGRVEALRIKPDIQIETLKDKVRPQIANEVAGGGEAPWYERIAETAWSQIKDIVVIHHDRAQAAPLMSPKEAYFLHQNLRLELEAMRLSLLRGDAVSYQETAQLVLGWLDRYFDGNDAATKAVAEDVRALAQTQLVPYLPDLGATAKTFDEVLARRQPVRSALSPAEPAAPGAGEAAQ